MTPKRRSEINWPLAPDKWEEEEVEVVVVRSSEAVLPFRLARGAQLGLIFKLSPVFDGEALADWLLFVLLKLLKRFWMAPPLLPRPPEAATEAAAEADKDVQPPPADEDVVLWAGDEPDTSEATSETSVEVDMGESICEGPLARYHPRFFDLIFFSVKNTWLGNQLLSTEFFENFFLKYFAF